MTYAGRSSRCGSAGAAIGSPAAAGWAAEPASRRSAPAYRVTTAPPRPRWCSASATLARLVSSSTGRASSIIAGQPVERAGPAPAAGTPRRPAARRTAPPPCRRRAAGPAPRSAPGRRRGRRSNRAQRVDPGVQLGVGQPLVAEDQRELLAGGRPARSASSSAMVRVDDRPSAGRATRWPARPARRPAAGRAGRPARRGRRPARVSSAVTSRSSMPAPGRRSTTSGRYSSLIRRFAPGVSTQVSG